MAAATEVEEGVEEVVEEGHMNHYGQPGYHQPNIVMGPDGNMMVVIHILIRTWRVSVELRNVRTTEARKIYGR